MNGAAYICLCLKLGILSREHFPHNVGEVLLSQAPVVLQCFLLEGPFLRLPRASVNVASSVKHSANKSNPCFVW